MRYSRAPEFYVKRVESMNKRFKRDAEMRCFRVKAGHIDGHPHKFTTDRELYQYNFFFSPALRDFFGKRISIADALLQIPRGKNQALRICEDGPGKGYALNELIRDIGEKVKVDATALTMVPEKELLSSAEYLPIKIVIGDAETFVPKKPIHSIISFFGSVHFSQTDSRFYKVTKDHLLKFAHSLTKGGLMLTAMYDEKIESQFSEMKKIEKRFKEIEASFLKRGFKAKFYLIPHGEGYVSGAKSWPNLVFLIRREK